MNLKELLNEVLAQSTFLVRSAFTSSADVDDIQMVSIANRVSYEIFNYFNWSGMRNTHLLLMTETAGVPDIRYDLPDDYQSIVPDSAWETDGSRRVELPVPESRWFVYKYTAFSDGGTIRARIYGDQIEIHDPEPGESFQFEYVTKFPITDSGGTPKERFTLDTDLFILDDQLFILGVQAHWAHAKRIPQYGDWFQNYTVKMTEAISRDAQGRTIGGANSGLSWWNSRGPYYPLYRPR